MPILPRFLLEIEEAKLMHANRYSQPSVIANDSYPVLLNSTTDLPNTFNSSWPSNATLAPDHFHNASSANGTNFKAGCFDSSDSAENRYKALKGESTNLGILLASKSFVQLLINPSVGMFANR